MRDYTVRGNATARALTALLAFAAIGACSTTEAPEASPIPPAASAETLPVAWFAENWGPFDATLNGSKNGRAMPLLVVDGRQVDRRKADNELPGSLSIEDISRVRAIKCPADLDLFGAAGQNGIIMIFTTGYEGPIPTDRTAADAARCARGAPK